MRSELQCEKCKLVSIRYDEFSTVPLPLPESRHVIVVIVLYLLPPQVKAILKGACNYESVQPQEPEEEEKEEKSREEVVVTREDSVEDLPERPIQNQQNITYNERPVKLSLKLNRSVELKQLVAQICQMQDVDLLPTSYGLSEVTVYDQSAEKKACVTSIYEMDREILLGEVRSGTTYIATEILSLQGKRTLYEHYVEHPELKFSVNPLMLPVDIEQLH